MKRVAEVSLRALGAFFAAALIVGGLLFIPKHRVYLHRAPFVDIVERLPGTLILVGASVVVAIIVASICVLLTSRERTAMVGRILSAASFAVMCVPVFWLALMAQLTFAVHGVHLRQWFFLLPAAGIQGSDTFSVRDLLVHLITPAGVLALFQSGAYVDGMRRGISGRALFSTFAVLLPAILSADMVIESIFAWPGEGREFYFNLVRANAPYVMAFLVVNAAIVVAVRTLARVITGPDDSTLSAVLEAL